MLLLPESIITIIRYLLGVLFVFSGIAKLPNLKGFAKIVENYDVVPYRLTKIVSYPLPFIELIAGVLILLDAYQPYSSILIILLLLASTGFILYALIEKRKMTNCGCFGTILKVPVSWRKLFENLFWLVLAILLVIANIS